MYAVYVEGIGYVRQNGLATDVPLDDARIVERLDTATKLARQAQKDNPENLAVIRDLRMGNILGGNRW